MSSAISFYQTLNMDLKNRIGFEGTKYNFFYDSGSELLELSSEPIEGQENKDSHLYLKDGQNNWEAEKYNLLIKRSGTIYNTNFLFGSSGLASIDSVIGIAFAWISKSSNQRGIVPIGEIRNGLKDGVNFELDSIFKSGQLKGTVTIEVILYLKKNINNNYSHLAQYEGTILGILDSYTVVIDGTGSMFPILEVNEPSLPLWWVSCDWTDPLSDSFSEENVSININIGHKYAKLLKSESGFADSPMLLEVISSSLQIIIQKAMQSEVWDNIKTGSGVEPGSIGQAIFYFIQTFNWDVSSPERLARSIREDLEKRA